MGTFNNTKLKNIRDKKFAQGVTTLLTLVVSFFVIIVTILEKGFANSLLMISFILVINIIAVLKYYPYFKNKMEFRDIDKKIFTLSYAFLNYLNFEEVEKENKLKELFSVHFKNDVDKLFQKYKNKGISYISICKALSKYKSDVKYFAIYTLLDIASEDKMYSIEDERFIEEVVGHLRIHKMSFDAIKNAYLKKGLKEERKILEEEARRKTTKELTKTFLPYNAYKILGVTPSVTKRQLKKVYRTLAKKYHPDKFYGQSDAILKEMEIRFQEVAEAYEVVKNFKKI